MAPSSVLLAIALLVGHAAARTTLVTGATGQTGTLVYNTLRSRHHDVRALVRSPDKAREKLHCNKCDQSEGIFVADITKPQDEAFTAAFRHVSSVVILTASFPIKLPNGSWTFPEGGFPKDIDWHGVNSQVAAATKAGVKHVVLVSSMGTTEPNSFLDNLGNGHVLFYKTQGELGLMSNAHLNFTIVKPSGLVNELGGKRALLTGHFDELARTKKMSVPRADVAAVVVAAVELPARSGNLWFDLTSDPDGPTTTDFGALFDGVRAMW